jgi:hypothetical protein
MFRVAHWLTVSLPRSLFATLPVLLVAACIAAVSPVGAHVHHGPDGRSVSWYPADCCHDGDCHPVSRIRAWSDGLLMTTEDGTTLFVNPAKARRPSRDGRWHVCYGAGENPSIHCVFEPPES